jgi:predicted deacetylase
MLHGYSHQHYEFMSDDADVLQQKLTDGLAILKTAFPAAQIQTFIAPYDKVSPVAIELILGMGLSLCTHSDNIAVLPGQAGIRGYTRQILPTGSRLYTCDEYLFDLSRPASDSLENARQQLKTEPLVIAVNHYWNYFYDWNGVMLPLMDAWQTFVRDIIQAQHPVTRF